MSCIVIDLLLGWAIQVVVDMFAYDNCIILHPLTIAMPDGSTKAYVGNIKGGRKILPMVSSVTDEA